MRFQIIDSNTLFGTHPTHRLDLSVERLLRDMDRHKIAASLTLSTVGVFYGYVEGNRETLDAAKGNKRLAAVATVNPHNYFGSTEELQDLKAHGFRIFKFYPGEQGWPVDSAAFGRVLQELAPLNMPIMVNAVLPGEATGIGRVIASYPAPVILCSVSGETLSEALAVASAAPNIMVETHELHVPGALKLLAERIGAERIIFGSGAPRRSVASSLYYVLHSELSDSEKQLALGGNIKRILEAA